LIKQARTFVAVAAVLAAFSVLPGCRRGGSTAASAGSDMPVSSHAGSVMHWESGWKQALNRAQHENKAVLVDFYADWCVWCRRLDTTTYRDPAVLAYVNSNLVPVKLNVDARDGQALARQYGVDGLPTIVILGANGKEMGRIPGYLPADRFLDAVRHFVGS
jgi:thiol:disulfide interchange protein